MARIHEVFMYPLNCSKDIHCDCSYKNVMPKNGKIHKYKQNNEKNNNIKVSYFQPTCTSSDHKQYPCKVTKRTHETVRGVALT